ncbi:MAG TPA: glycine--tRNA ligase subunit beta, partial [Thiotrichales bacterium]|nr:glycine--tRNA ligase subunit beta [Thiotrichales bacterium]
DEALLEEVAAMVEWPVAVTGRFEERFLQVPQEALISTMKANQKYFHVVDGEGRLLPRFITIANIESRDPDVVREGNERVIRPRLADAEFFWNQDRKQPLDAHVERLATILFQQKLGTLHDKAARVEHLATWIAARIGGDETWARRAAWLAKCDLMTEMVYEFPELQGIMGRYYAAADGEPEEVSRAMEEQYLPRFAGDRLPGTRTGQALAVADKLDTVCGLFAIGQPPTGSKDPFALRRNALGALRILIEGGLDIDLESLLEEARQALGERVETDDLTGQVFDFMMERLRAWYHDQGVAPDSFEAVLARRPTRPLDFHHRLLAVSHFRSLPEAEALAAANKRIANILRQAREKGIDFPERVETARLESEPERDLAEAVERLEQEVGPLAEAGEYEPALGRLASLREVVDRFFDQVMVMVDDPPLRGNRLALLARLQALFLRVADISRLQA